MSQEMKDAILKRRGPAVNLTIEVEQSKKDTDLAPAGDQPPAPGAPDPLTAVVPNSIQQGKELEGVALPQMNPDDLAKLSQITAGAGGAKDPMQAALDERVVEASKDGLKGRKPRSLVERATMAHMGK